MTSISTLNQECLQKYFTLNNFFNRDLSWIEFNKRVIEEAFTKNLPLLDKIKFISIFFSNLDEFFMIRVSGLTEQVKAKIIEPTIDGLTPSECLIKIENEIKPLINDIYDYWNNYIVNELSESKIIITKFDDLNKTEQNNLRRYFYKEIFPVLTPLAFDPGRPFPHISNLSLSFAVLIKKTFNERHFARVKIPSNLPRLVRIDNIFDSTSKKNNSNTIKFIWLEDLVRNNLCELFPGIDLIEAHSFRVTRDTDMEIQEDEADDLLSVIEENIKQRRFGSVVRLEVETSIPDFMLETLKENLQIDDREVYRIDGPLGLSSVMELYGLPMHNLKEKAFFPITPPVFETSSNFFSLIKKNDILLHHPYDSFTPVVDFIKQATYDPDVLAIKQTLYRVGANSPIVKSLIEAAEQKKQVAVLVELKARFDEENNIYWARELEKAGVHVVYGLVGLKTHAKMTLVVKRESDGVKRYVHLSTGNYNTSTAKLYTDFGLFTCNEEICSDVSEIFNFLTGYSEKKKFNKLIVAPINTREKILSLIEREIRHAKKGQAARIIFKLNSLVDPTSIAALYEASTSGVKIDLIVRGICCLVPQIPGLSENIRVTSIVGRFLEHSRVYYFLNNGEEEIYLSSADLMQRNLDRRVEVTFPVENAKLKSLIKTSLLNTAIEDTEKSRILLPNGRYVNSVRVFNQDKINTQENLMNFVINQAKKIQKKEKFIVRKKF